MFLGRVALLNCLLYLLHPKILSSCLSSFSNSDGSHILLARSDKVVITPLFCQGDD